MNARANGNCTGVKSAPSALVLVTGEGSVGAPSFEERTEQRRNPARRPPQQATALGLRIQIPQLDTFG
jgi:hypothetical protein